MVSGGSAPDFGKGFCEGIGDIVLMGLIGLPWNRPCQLASPVSPHYYFFFFLKDNLYEPGFAGVCGFPFRSRVEYCQI